MVLTNNNHPDSISPRANDHSFPPISTAAVQVGGLDNPVRVSTTAHQFTLTESFAMWLALSLCLCALFVLSVAGAKPAGAQIGQDFYRLNVEAILEPPGDTAVYRVQLWTASECPVYLDIGCGQVAQPLASRPEEGSTLWRADVTILVCLRTVVDPPQERNATNIECRLLRSGGGGITFTDRVATVAKLEDLIDVVVGESTKRRGEKHMVAQLNGKSVDVWAGKSSTP